MGLGEWLAKALKMKDAQGAGSDKEAEAAKAKAGAEEINKRLPEAVSGRAAVLKHRERMKQIDALLEER